MDRLGVVSYHSSPLVEPGSGDSGGMTIYVRELAEAMARQGVRTDIFTRATGDQSRITELSPLVRAITIDAGPGSLSKSELPAYIGEFSAGIADLTEGEGIHYDAIHSHYWQSGLAAKALVERWNVPFVHSHHTLARVKNSHLAAGDVPEPQERIDGEMEVIRSADVLVASTDDEWDHLACLYGASHDRLKTIHPGVDHSLFSRGDRAAARALLGLRDEVVVLYVGRIQRLKGIELAVRAVEQLVGPVERDVVFMIVGGASGTDGDSEVRRLNELVTELDLESNVRFMGPQRHDCLPAFYNASDALVVCSHSESFGLAALEAQACGTPVVGTPVGGLSYVVRDGESGFLVDTRDPVVFASRLKTLLGDEQLIRDFRVSAVRSAQAFSWKRSAAEFIELFNCLMTERAPHLCTC
ncbi:MAG: glycosyltransferase [Actinomycetota bacterium]|nr:glycosyltransferase [Actinomycetota bacterium]